MDKQELIDRLKSIQARVAGLGSDLLLDSLIRDVERVEIDKTKPALIAEISTLKSERDRARSILAEVAQIFGEPAVGDYAIPGRVASIKYFLRDARQEVEVLRQADENWRVHNHGMEAALAEWKALAEQHEADLKACRGYLATEKGNVEDYRKALAKAREDLSANCNALSIFQDVGRAVGLSDFKVGDLAKLVEDRFRDLENRWLDKKKESDVLSAESDRRVRILQDVALALSPEEIIHWAKMPEEIKERATEAKNLVERIAFLDEKVALGGEAINAINSLRPLCVPFADHSRPSKVVECLVGKLRECRAVIREAGELLGLRRPTFSDELVPGITKLKEHSEKQAGRIAFLEQQQAPGLNLEIKPGYYTNAQGEPRQYLFSNTLGWSPVLAPLNSVTAYIRPIDYAPAIAAVNDRVTRLENKVDAAAACLNDAYEDVVASSENRTVENLFGALAGHLGAAADAVLDDDKEEGE